MHALKYSDTKQIINWQPYTKTLHCNRSIWGWGLVSSPDPPRPALTRAPHQKIGKEGLVNGLTSRCSRGMSGIPADAHQLIALCAWVNKESRVTNLGTAHKYAATMRWNRSFAVAAGMRSLILEKGRRLVAMLWNAIPTLVSLLSDRYCWENTNKIQQFLLPTGSPDVYVCRQHCLNALQRYQKLQDDIKVLHANILCRFAAQCPRSAVYMTTLTPSVAQC